MTDIAVISIGRKDPYLEEACLAYAKRLISYCRFEWVLIKESTSSMRAKDETQKLIAYVNAKKKGRTLVILLDERGASYTSTAFAAQVETWQSQAQQLFFLIGGADGLDHSQITIPHVLLSLSKMTLPHRLCRLFLVEQIYRAMTIIASHPYHH